MEENHTLKEMTLDQAVGTLLNELPAPVRTFVTSPQRDQVAMDIMRKYGLHADQAGIFQRAYIFMLLGIMGPQDFMIELQNTGISAEMTGNIAKDVNERVFIPLRQQEQQPPSTPQASLSKPTIPPMQVTVPKPPLSTNVPTQNPIPTLPNTPPTPKPPQSSVNSSPAAPTPQQAPRNAALHNVLKQYGVDPYREPLE